MQFLDFYNRQTYHFFQWLTRSGVIDLRGMVERALADAQKDEWLPTQQTPSEIACQLLAERIEEAAFGLARERFEFGVLEPGDDAFGEQQTYGYESADALFVPLVHDALEHVMYPVVAQAVLMQHGEWKSS